MENFEQILAGGHAMDTHFRQAEFRQNMPVIMGLLSVWYTNFFKAEAQAVIPYDHYLHKFPSFLQQLEMESNGKSVRRNGEPVKYHTKGVIFGEAGSNTQHSFHQLLHQGTHCIPVDFIVPALSHNPLAEQHGYLFANCLSQSRALMVGRSFEQVTEELRDKGLGSEEIKQLAPHKVIPGNKPSNTIVMEKLTPFTLGALIALYEHKVFVESVIWDIDAFDQWGVELGKLLAEDIYEVMQNEKAGVDLDDSTKDLIRFYQGLHN
jgi:glucose-6-phosphate isomerase